MMNLMGRFLKGRAESYIKRTTDLIPITEFNSDDVFIVGYPRSGNSWVHNLVAGIIYYVDLGYIRYSIINDLIPGVHRKRYYKRYSQTMFFSSHHLPKPNYKRVVYLVRDG